MRRTNINFIDLIKKNKEELLRDKVQIEKIEKHVEQKIISQK